MAGIDEHLGAGAEAPADERGGSPVREIRAVEAGLEELVLDEEREVVGELCVEPLEALDQPCESRPEVVLARVVGSVGEPEANGARACGSRDLEAGETLLER